MDAREQPCVCICVPIYNAESTIAETVRSILGQTYRNLVIKLVDNASNDRTNEILRSFDDPRIRIIRGEENIGGEGNFDRCLSFADGKYTAIFHADDVYGPEMVARQVAYMESNPLAGAIFSAADFIDEAGSHIGGLRRPSGLPPADSYDFPQIFKAILRHSNFLICPSALVRTEIFRDEIKRWRWDMFGSSADLDVWLRIAERHSIGILDDPNMRVRVSSGQWTDRVRRDTGRADFFRVTDYYLGKDDVRALLSPRDMENYEVLERRDRAARSINLFLANKPEEALSLASDMCSSAAIRACLTSKRGMVTWLTFVYLKLVIAFAPRTGKAVLAYFKRKSHR